MSKVRIVTQWETGSVTDPSPAIVLSLEGTDREIPPIPPLRGQEGGRFLVTPDAARQIGKELVQLAEELGSKS